MGSDGAYLGVGAERALETIIGAKDQPSQEECESADEMRNRILSTPYLDVDYKNYSYDECATAAAHAILDAFLNNPALARIPTEAEYDWDSDPDRGAAGMKDEFVISIGLYETMKVSAPEQYIALKNMGLSGFMWGWAVNAARRCVELPPVPNPAIIEI